MKIKVIMVLFLLMLNHFPIYGLTAEVHIGKEYQPVSSIMDLRFFEKSHNVIRDVVEFDGNLWIAVWGKGIFVVRDSRIVRNLQEKDGLPGNYINDLEVFKERIFIGAKEGIARISKDFSIQSAPWFSKSLSLPVIHCICVLSEDQILAGTTGDGIYLADWGDKSVKRVLSSEWNQLWLNCIRKDEKGTFWFATGNGLIHTDSNFKITPFKGSSSVFVVSTNSLCFIPEGVVSGSCGDGVILSRGKDYHYFSKYSKNLLVDSVYQVDSTSDTIWCGTEKGLLVIDYKKSDFQTELLMKDQSFRTVSFQDPFIYAGTFQGKVYKIDSVSRKINKVFEVDCERK